MTRSYAILSSLNVICTTFTIDRVVAMFTFLQNVNEKNTAQLSECEKSAGNV